MVIKYSSLECMGREMPPAAPELSPVWPKALLGQAGGSTRGTGSRNRHRAPNPLRAPHRHQGSRAAFPGILWEHFHGKHSHKHSVNHGTAESHKPQIPRAGMWEGSLGSVAQV